MRTLSGVGLSVVDGDAAKNRWISDKPRIPTTFQIPKGLNTLRLFAPDANPEGK
jgi:hypothetical protein